MTYYPDKTNTNLETSYKDIEQIDNLKIQINNISKEISKNLKDIFERDPKYVSKEIFQILKLIEYFIESVTLNDAHRAVARINIALKKDNGNPNDKSVLEGLLKDFITLIEQLEYIEVLTKASEINSQKEYINIQLSKQLKSLLLKDSEEIIETPPSQAELKTENLTENATCTGSLNFSTDKKQTSVSLDDVKHHSDDYELINYIAKLTPERKAILLEKCNTDPSIQNNKPNFKVSFDPTLPFTSTPNPVPRLSRVQNVSSSVLSTNAIQQPFTVPFSLHHGIQTICEYNGHSDMLPVFCASIRNVRDAFGPASEPWILNALVSKLKGPAAIAFAARIPTYTSIDSLLKDLNTQFWGREGADALKRKLQTISQLPNESASSFGLRVQCLHNSLINNIDQDPNIIDNNHRTILKEMAVKDSREQFLCGLRPELETATRIKNPVFLNEAILAASAHKSNRGLRDPPRSTSDANIQFFSANSDYSPDVQYISAAKDTESNELYCKFCKRNTHDIINCRTFRRKIINENNQNATPKPSRCDFCMKPGHFYTECRSLRSKIINDYVSQNENISRRNAGPSYNTNIARRNINNYRPRSYNNRDNNNNQVRNNYSRESNNRRNDQNTENYNNSDQNVSRQVRFVENNETPAPLLWDGTPNTPSVSQDPLN